jgi:hypothetical protein
MGKGQCSAQNGEVPNAVAPSDAAAPGRQRPEEILAQTLTSSPHPAATDGWSSRGRRIFLIAMAVAGVVLVVAGLLVTKELAPGPGTPAPLETGPGNSLAGQLLQSSSGDQLPPTVPRSTPLALPLPATPTTVPARTATPTPTPVAPAVPTQQPNNQTTQPTTAPSPLAPAPPTTVPCTGLLGLRAVQLPCKAPALVPSSG